uniref:Serpin family F member 2 n=1 Tax=Sphenodon punctatus TaxID=8508 RepID=A0A8D0GTN8_SPHPU
SLQQLLLLVQDYSCLSGEHFELASGVEGSGFDKATSLEQTHRLADTMMQFTIDLLREMQRDNSKDNVILSPFSIALALSQLALGAANQTEKHLLEALHVEALPCLHQMLSSVRKELTKTVLDMAARIYLQKGFEVKEKFLEDSERFYGAKPETLSGDGEDDLLAINNWVKEATNGQIPSFLTELPQSVVMILLNAVHFQGFWRHKFSPSLTAPDMFRLNDEFMVSVEMMKAQKYPLSWFTLDDLDVQVAKFPFKGNMSFVAIVPNQFEWNITQVLVSLNQAELRSRFPREKPTLVKMPKLHLDYQVELNQALRRLGLGELFSRPDLQHISEGPLFVSSIQHQSALRLAEDGVEASAATGVLMSRSISTFSLNQPFVFIIYEETTGIPIFLGNIQNPNPSAPQQRIEQQDSPDDKNVVQGVIPK